MSWIVNWTVFESVVFEPVALCAPVISIDFDDGAIVRGLARGFI